MGLIISGVLSSDLKGDKILNLSLKGLLEHDKEAKNLGHVVLTMLRKFKGGTRLNCHIIPIDWVTKTRIDNRY